MTQLFGSLTNHLVGTSKQPVIPEVGMGATMLCWTDRHAFTIIAVRKGGAEIDVQGDIATRIDSNGFSDAQKYAYTADPNGETHTVTLRKNGVWVTKGHGMKDGQRWWIGVRDEHYDYSF